MSLTNEQLERIKSFKKRLGEVEPTPIEVTFQNFKDEIDPNKEISVWERITDRYEELISFIENPGIVEKTAVFKKALIESFDDPRSPVIVTKSES